MELNYIKVNPCGNTTAYILDPLPRHLYPLIAKELIKKECLSVEQVGFIEIPENKEADIRLHMQAGEFCGNATRGLATWVATRNNPFHKTLDEKTKVIKMEVSGSKELLNAKITITEDPHIKIAEVKLPLPIEIIEEETHTLVVFEGIIHVVGWDIKPSTELFNQLSQDVINKYGPYEGLGLMFYNSKTKEMIPLVHIPEINELIWESSCGSGTAALGIALAKKKNTSIKGLKVPQPGGIMTVNVNWVDEVTDVTLSGPVSIVSQGTVFINLSI